MAEKKASLIIELRDMASAGISSLAAKIFGLTAAFAAVTGFVIKSFTAFGEHEVAALRLTTALGNVGTSGAGASQRLQGLAEALSKTTGFTNTSIVSMQAMLATMGFNEAAISQMTPRVLDLARATGVDMVSASMALGKSIESGSNMPLKRLGITLEAQTFKNYDFAGSMAAIDGRVKGMGQSFSSTAEGAMAKYHAAVESLMESLGALLSKAFIPIINAATKFIEILSATVPVISVILSSIKQLSFAFWDAGKASLAFASGDFAGAMLSGQKAVGDLKNATVDKASEMLAAMKKMAAGIKDIFSNDQGKKPNTPGTGAPGKPDFSIIGLPTEEQIQQKILQLRGLSMAAEKIAVDREARLLVIAKRGAEAEQLLNSFKYKAMASAATNFFGNLATLSQSKNKTLLEIGKASAIAQALVASYLAYNEALANPPGPPWSYGIAASALAAGMVQVANISSVKMAMGGMVLPSSGGTFANVAEAGRAEAVIPLDDPQTTQKLRATLGGGEVHIHVGTLIADQGGLEDFARRIDKVFWRLKKNGQTVAI